MSSQFSLKSETFPQRQRQITVLQFLHPRSEEPADRLPLQSLIPTDSVYGGSLMSMGCCTWVAVQCAVTSIILSTESWTHPVTEPNATDRGGSSSNCDPRHFPIRHSLMGGSGGRRYTGLTIQWPPARFMYYRP